MLAATSGSQFYTRRLATINTSSFPSYEMSMSQRELGLVPRQTRRGRLSLAGAANPFFTSRKCSLAFARAAMKTTILTTLANGTCPANADGKYIFFL